MEKAAPGPAPLRLTAAAAACGCRVPAAPTAGAQEKPETAKGQVEVVELTKLQQTVARRMAESKATAPHFYLQAEIDMTAAVAARKRLKEIGRARARRVPTFNDMVVKACALALREFPRANGAYRDGKIELYSRVNVGVAVAAQDALVVPTVFDADLKGLRQIAAETRGARRAGARRLDHPARALGRDVHRLQPRDVRDLQLPRGDQHAAGGDPRGRRAEGEAGRSPSGEIDAAAS